MKTSIWLPDEVAEQWKASGDSLADLVKRGLATGKPEPLDDKIRRIIREEMPGILAEHVPDAVTKDELRSELERVAGHS